MGKFRIIQNTRSGLYKIQVPFLLFWWSTLQESVNGDSNHMMDKHFKEYDEAEKEAEKYCRTTKKDTWKDVTKQKPNIVGGYQGGDSKGKRGTPPRDM